MARTNKLSLGRILIQIALAVLFIFDGLFLLGFKGGFFSGSDAGDIRTTITKVFGRGDVAQILTIVLGILILLCGVLLVVRFFWDPSKLSTILNIIILVVWIVMAVLVDVLPVSGISHASWWIAVAKDLLVIGGILSLHD